MTDEMKIFVGDNTFGTFDLTARYLLADAGMEEVSCLQDAEGVIAGTESYNSEVLSTATKLKVISRMGVGFDNVDLKYCEKHRIVVTYTPDAPAGSVAELIIAQIFNMTRQLHTMNNSIHHRRWDRPLGRKISELVIGVVGVGRIGKRVIKRLQPFSPKDILAYDTNDAMVTSWWGESNYAFVPSISLDKVLAESDIISVSVPMSKHNHNMVDHGFIGKMKQGSYLINTSRGEILDEEALLYWLINSEKLAGVAIDVFSDEPYEGDLILHDKVLLSSHVGSMTLSTRIDMETQAARDCMSVLNGHPPAPGNLVPFERGDICEHS